MRTRYREPAVATLVVGLGGVGVRVLRQLKHRVASRPELDNGLLGCFSIDTEPGVQRRELGGAPPLEDDELLVLDGLEVRRLASRLASRGEGQSFWPDIESWLPDPAGLRLLDDLAPMGEALLRPLGRLVFWRFEELVRMHVSRALRRMELERGPARLDGIRRVAVVASAGGGTGSGMLGDMVELLRGYEDVVELLVFLVTPTQKRAATDEERADMRTPRRRRGEANAYACLKEIYHLKAGTLRWRGGPETRAGRPRRDRWCERIYVSDDATGGDVADAIAFHLLRAGQARAARMFDRLPELELGARLSERRWAPFSFAAARRVDLTQYPAPSGLAPAATPDPSASEAEATNPSESGGREELNCAALDEAVETALRDLADRRAELSPARSPDGCDLALFADVFGIPSVTPLGSHDDWREANALQAARRAAEGVVRDQPAVAKRYVDARSRHIDPGLDQARADWRRTMDADAREEARRPLWRRLTGITRTEALRRNERVGWALLRNALGGDGGRSALVGRVRDLLLDRALSRSPETPEPPPVVPPPVEDPLPPRMTLDEIIEQCVLAIRPRIFQVAGPRRERLTFCLALVPRGRDDVVAVLRDRVPEMLDCDVEVAFHDIPDVLWVYHEDPFREPRDILGLDDWYRTYASDAQKQVFHTDRHFLDDAEFKELVGEDGLHKASCGNPACKHDIRREPRRPDVCPGCKHWIRSRCGNATCTLDGLHQHPQAKARSCPGCGGVNHAAWWPCPRHGKIEHLVPMDKPRCPECVERHLADPLAFREDCIGRRPDLGRVRECPGCAARRTKDATHVPLLIGPDLMPFVLNGVNGHDTGRFHEVARSYKLNEDYICPRCRCYLIPVHHARLARSAQGKDCREEQMAPEAFPIATVASPHATNGAAALESAPRPAPVDPTPAS